MALRVSGVLLRDGDSLARAQAQRDLPSLELEQPPADALESGLEVGAEGVAHGDYVPLNAS